MQYSCYRCGAAVEEQTLFCASCGAPQIRVNVAQEAPLTSDAPVTPPLEPGTPAAIQPPTLPVHFDGRTIVPRKRFLRQVWPFALASGIMLGLVPLIGLLCLAGSIIYCIRRYRRNHPGPFSRSDGARLGMVTALLSFLPFMPLYSLRIAADPQPFREAMLHAIQQRAAADPQSQAILNWASTNEGFLAFVVMTVIIFMLLLLVISAAVGAITASMDSNRSQS
jgi:hypothetical protein